MEGNLALRSTRVIRIRAGNGDFLAAVVQGELAIPHFAAAGFAISQFHKAGSSPSSAEQALTAVACWIDFLDAECIDWRERTRCARFLPGHELERLADRFAVTRDGRTPVAPQTVAMRLGYIEHFLRWQLNGVADHAWHSMDAADAWGRAMERFLGRLRRTKPRSRQDPRPRSVCPTEVAALAALLQRKGGSDLWADPFVADRNLLWFEMEFEEGHRRGELLNLRLSDIDVTTGVYRIVRRRDCAHDPRRRKPSVKGFSRTLDLSPGLARHIDRHVQVYRNAQPGAAAHDLLFVAKGGAPWSLDGVTIMHRRLRERHPEIGHLTRHAGRHEWNEGFSEACDREGQATEKEVKARAHQMGWRDPNSARHYLSRHNRRLANEVSLTMQRRLMAEPSGK